MVLVAPALAVMLEKRTESRRIGISSQNVHYSLTSTFHVKEISLTSSLFWTLLCSCHLLTVGKAEWLGGRRGADDVGRRSWACGQDSTSSLWLVSQCSHQFSVVLCHCCLEILDNFVFELVFCKWRPQGWQRLLVSRGGPSNMHVCYCSLPPGPHRAATMPMSTDLRWQLCSQTWSTHTVSV